MQIGMMWLDIDPKTSLTQKVITAADYYRHKYGCVPTGCRVNPKALITETEIHVGIVTVKPMREIMPGHLWIGMEEQP